MIKQKILMRKTARKKSKIKKKRNPTKRKKRVQRKIKKSRSIYPSEDELVKRVEKFKTYRKIERRKVNITSLLFLLLLLLILMYIGASIKGQFIMSQCVDTDYGKNAFMLGTLRYVENGEISTLKDNCIDQTHLKEFYCEDGKPVGEVIECENGCLNGRCLSVGSCTDSDEGINPEGKGICIDQEGSHLDECYSNKELTEYYCSEGMCLSTRVVCNGICYAGRCVPDIETGKILECEEQLGECMLPVECRDVKGTVIGECSEGYVCCLK